MCGYHRLLSYRQVQGVKFLFFPIFLGILLFFLFFSNFLLFFLFFSHFTYNKQIFVRDLKILSLFKYVVYRLHLFFFIKIVFIIPEMFVLIRNKAIYKDFDSQGNSCSTFSLNFPIFLTFVNFFFLSIFKQFII